jgi:hypothetical protein
VVQYRDEFMTLVGKPEKEDHSEDLIIDGRILKWLLK